MAEYIIKDSTITALANAIRIKSEKTNKMTTSQMVDEIMSWDIARAFAVYSDYDKSLNFYKRNIIPKAGEQFEGKIATDVYTGIEVGQYDKSYNVPWANRATSIQQVKIVDKISPISTAYWFYNFLSVSTINMENLNTKNVVDMSYMFAYCKSKNIDVSKFNTSKVVNMSNMFYYCGTSNLDVSKFDVSCVTDMSSMFNRCFYIKLLDMSKWNMPNIINMSDMFFSCELLQQVMIGEGFRWVGTKPYLPSQQQSKIPGADGKWYALSDRKGYTPENIPSNKADTYYAYTPTETWNTITRTNVPAMGTSSDIFVSPSKRTKYRATLDTASSAQGRGMSVYIYNANSGSMINSVQLSTTGARTQYFELNQGNYKINAFFDCYNGYSSTLILEENIGFEFAPIN